VTGGHRSSRLVSATSTDLFVHHRSEDLQVVRVTVARPPDAEESSLEIVGDDVRGECRIPAGTGVCVLDVPVRTGRTPPGTRLPAVVRIAGGVETEFTVDVAEVGWTIHLISHFHFDSVWWNTQAGSVTEWAHSLWSASPQLAFQKSAVDVLLAHLRRAQSDPAYRFVVAEVDYLKPLRDRYPEFREMLARLIAVGQVEVVGGTWNEPDTALPALEPLRRNLAYGLGYQRGVLGAPVTTSWALDVFGHAPQYPAVAAEAGLTAVALARGGYHQWGQLRDSGFDAPHSVPRQHATETAWTAPGGRRLVLHSLPMHYTGGHALDAADTVEDAEALVLEWLTLMRPHAAARAVVIPAGTDLSSPSRWITELPARFARRYAWPRLRLSLPGEAFAEIASEARSDPRPGTARGLRTLTRDLNPVYTGKDVSYADVKLAHTFIERLTIDAELWSALVPASADNSADLDRAWRLLVWLSHHDAVTGTSSDQVYVDLLAAWREAYDRADAALASTLHTLGGTVDTSAQLGVPVLVANSAAHERGGLIRCVIDVSSLGSSGVVLIDRHGSVVPMVIEGATRAPDGALREVDLLALVPIVPGTGYRTFWLAAAAETHLWRMDDGVSIASSNYLVDIDLSRGGAITSLRETESGRELLARGRLAGELVVDIEHPTHPDMGEGPWHLLPTGQRERVGMRPATSGRRERSAVGERLIVDGPLPPACGLEAVHTTTYFLPADGSGLRVTHRLSGQSIDDRLVRAAWPLPIAGSRAVFNVGEAVIGRGHGFTTADTAQHPWTLDSAFQGWIAQSSVCRLEVTSGGSVLARRAIGAVEVVASEADEDCETLGDLLAEALARSGVTATPTRESDLRVGDLVRDSNLIDLRIVISGTNEAGAPSVAWVRDAGVETAGVFWLPARSAVRNRWIPGADLTGTSDLPVLAVVAGTSDERRQRIEAIAAELDRSHSIAAEGASADIDEDVDLENRTVALITSGAHSAVVDTDGTMWLNLRRSSTAWPAGQWIDPPKRTLPDGSTFASQHWTHEIEYVLVSGDGDWREMEIDLAARNALRPLRTVPAGGGGLADDEARCLIVDGPGVLESARRLPGGSIALRFSQLDSTGVVSRVRSTSAAVSMRRSDLTG
jgi:hypothetical protein